MINNAHVMEMHGVRSPKSISLMTKRLSTAPLQVHLCQLGLPTEVVRIPKKKEKQSNKKTVVQATATSLACDKKNFNQLVKNIQNL